MLYKYFSKLMPAKIGYFIIIISLLTGFFIQSESLFNKYNINDDLRITIYWMQQFQDPELFQDDLLTDYATYFSNKGNALIFYMASKFFDIDLFSKILGIFLFSISSYFIFRIVASASDLYFGLIASLAYLSSSGIPWGGNPRGFTVPLIFMFLYFLINKKYWVATAIIVIQSLFSPIAWALSLIVYCICLFITIAGKFQFKKKNFGKIKYLILPLFVAIIISFVLLGSHYLKKDPKIGSLLSREEAYNNPALFEGGRPGSVELPTEFVLPRLNWAFKSKGFFGFDFIDRLDRWIFNKFLKSEKKGPYLTTMISYLTIAWIFLDFFRKKNVVPREITSMLFSGIIMYYAADIFLLKLYFPSRYIANAGAVLGLITYPLLIHFLINKIPIKNIQKLLKILLLVVIISVGFLNLKVNKFDIGSDNAPLYDYIGTLPKSVLIAAHPVEADNIPYFAKRSVYINRETSNPHYDVFWEEISRRTREFFDAYYAEDIHSVCNFISRNNIDYIVIKREHFSEEYLKNQKFYFEPFNSYINSILQQRKNFTLQQFFGQEAFFSFNNQTVIDKHSLLRMCYD